MNTDKPASSDPANESPFKTHLHDAIQERKGETKGAGQDGKSTDGDTPEHGKKKADSAQQPVVVAVIAATLPAPTTGALGLPTAGIEPGASGGNPTVASDGTPQATPETLPVTLPTPPAAPSQQGDLKANLAFALRLLDPQATESLSPSTAPSINPDVSLQPIQATAMPAQPAAPAIAGLGQLSSSLQPDASVQPIKVTTPAAQPAAPAIAGPGQSGDASRQSAQQGTGSDASEKEPNKDEPKVDRPRGAGQAPPAFETKPAREVAATSTDVTSAHRETALQTPGPAQTVQASTSVAPRMPEPAGSAAVAPIAQRGAAASAEVRANTASEVTDVSVTIPVPRADSSGEDRVAIRMMQRGTEIHVSVRTPDTQLAQSMRQDLGKLATELDHAGFRTETWRPVAAPAQSQSSSNHDSPHNAPNRDASGWDSPAGGQNGRGARDQKRQQQDQQPPRWVAELEQYRNQ